MRKLLGLLAITVMLGLSACGGSGSKEKTEEPQEMEKSEMVVQYTCSMHPDVIQNEPGKCPQCGMELVVKSDTQQPMDMPEEKE